MTECARLRTPCPVLADVLRPELPPADTSGPAEPTACADASLLAMLFRDHHDFVWSAARRLGCPAGNVDDAVQEVFMIAARKLALLRPPGVRRHWLFRATLYVVRNHRRGLQRRAQRHTLAAHGAPDHTPDPSDRWAAAAELLDLLESLDEDRRAVFVLSALEQWTAPEIAEALGIKLNTVYSRLRSARELPSLEAALTQELRVSCGFLSGDDFVEGVRAQVVDKDRNPQWKPATLEDVSDSDLDRYFAPLGAGDLEFNA